MDRRRRRCEGEEEDDGADVAIPWSSSHDAGVARDQYLDSFKCDRKATGSKACAISCARFCSIMALVSSSILIMLSTFMDWNLIVIVLDLSTGFVAEKYAI